MKPRITKLKNMKSKSAKSLRDELESNGLPRITASRILDIFQQWVVKHAPRPSARQVQEMSDSMKSIGNFHQSTEDYCQQWVKRMFLEPDVPQKIEAIWIKYKFDPNSQAALACLEAYRLGQEEEHVE